MRAQACLPAPEPRGEGLEAVDRGHPIAGQEPPFFTPAEPGQTPAHSPPTLSAPHLSGHPYPSFSVSQRVCNLLFKD